MITLTEYFAGYPDDPGITDIMRENARAMLTKVNALLDWAQTQGWVSQDNPATDTQVSGKTDGAGVRSPAVRAPPSRHTNKPARLMFTTRTTAWTG